MMKSNVQDSECFTRMMNFPHALTLTMVNLILKPVCCMITSVKIMRDWGTNFWLQREDGVGFPINHQEDTVEITSISFAIIPMLKSSRGLAALTLHSFLQMPSQLTGDQGGKQVVRVRKNDPIQGVEAVTFEMFQARVNRTPCTSLYKA